MPWVSGNFYLTKEQQQENATYFKILMETMWPEITLNAIAGMLGNAETESTCNPGIWQSLSMNPEAGYGFFQWTPAKNYLAWCNSEGLDPGHMNTVFFRLDYELTKRIQYYPTSKYPLTFREYIESTESPEYLAAAWLYNYERPEVMPQPIRSTQAKYWYDFLSGTTPLPPDPQPPTPKNNTFWWIYYLKGSD